MVATLGESTGMPALYSIRDKMNQHPIGRAILLEKPLITDESIRQANLGSLKEGTFGREYHEWMKQRAFKPSSRPTVHFVDHPQLAYIILRYRQVHDFWHVLAGLPTTVLSEVSLKALEFVQTGLPMCGLSSTVGVLGLRWSEKGLFFRRYLPWALSCGNNCSFLLNVRYEDHFQQDLQSFRHQLNFQPFV